MTYEERIEAITNAILEAMDITDGLDVEAAGTYARAADAACLKALEEPTEGMNIAGGEEIDKFDRRFESGCRVSEDAWYAMWSAIPRGDK